MLFSFNDIFRTRIQCQVHVYIFSPSLFYGVTALCSEGSMFRRFYVQKIFVQKVLCSEGSIFRRSYVQKVLCSEGPIFTRFYVQKVLCSKKNVKKVLYSEGSMLRRSYIQKVLYIQKILCFM